MKTVFLILPIFIYLTPAEALYAQNEKQAWKYLADVRFETKKMRNYDIEYPVFGKSLQNLNGKSILLRGYMLPLEETGKNTFIFSLYPYNSCYFCGGAGPETVVEVITKQKIAYREKSVLIKGILKLNDSDFEHLMYILQDAVLVE